MNAIAIGEIAMKRVRVWVQPSQCSSLREWVHRVWIDRSYWDGPDCLVFVLRRRCLGFEFEFRERKQIPHELM